MNAGKNKEVSTRRPFTQKKFKYCGIVKISLILIYYPDYDLFRL